LKGEYHLLLIDAFALIDWKELRVGVVAAPGQLRGYGSHGRADPKTSESRKWRVSSCDPQQHATKDYQWHDNHEECFHLFFPFRAFRRELAAGAIVSAPFFSKNLLYFRRNFSCRITSSFFTIFFSFF
jgi:hypothetical protein